MPCRRRQTTACQMEAARDAGWRCLGQSRVDSTHAVKVGADSPPSEHTQAALANLRQYWRTIWDRPPRSWDAGGSSFQLRFLHQQPRRAGLPSVHMSSNQWLVRFKDGRWLPEEHTLLRLDAWHAMARFVAHCEDVGQVPRTWRTYRQVHLDKGKPKQNDGSVLAGDLRPTQHR